MESGEYRPIVQQEDITLIPLGLISKSNHET
jgi:hypothetical protein